MELIAAFQPSVYVYQFGMIFVRMAEREAGLMYDPENGMASSALSDELGDAAVAAMQAHSGEPVVLFPHESFLPD